MKSSLHVFEVIESASCEEHLELFAAIWNESCEKQASSLAGIGK